MGTPEGINVLIWTSVGLKQRDRQNSQNLNNDTFFRPPVTSAQSIIGAEKHSDAGMLLNYDDKSYSQGHGQFWGIFRALTKGYVLGPYISDQDSRSTNVNAAGDVVTLVVNYTLLTYDIRKI